MFLVLMRFTGLENISDAIINNFKESIPYNEVLLLKNLITRKFQKSTKKIARRKSLVSADAALDNPELYI